MPLTILASLAALLCFSALAEDKPPVNFSHDIAPILERSCAGCHRPGKLKGGLDVTEFRALLKGGETGKVIEPGKPEESLLIQSIIGVPPDMPAEGEPLSADEIARIHTWVEEGALDVRLEATESLVTAPPVYHSVPAVAAIAYGPDGTLAVGGHREALLYDANGELKGRLTGQIPRIDSLAFSNDGKYLAVAACEPSVRSEIQLWELESRQLALRQAISEDSLFGLSFSPSDDRLAMGGADRMVRVIGIPSGAQLVRFANHTDWVFGASFTRDGEYIVTGSRDSSLRVLKAATGEFISHLAPSREPILALAVHPTDQQVVYGGENGGVRVYKIAPKEGFKDPGDNELYVRDYDNLGGAVYALAYSPDGKWIAVGGERDEIRIHQADNGHRVATLKGHRGAIFTCAFGRASDRVAAAGRDGLIRVYSVPSGQLMSSFPAAPLSPLPRRASR